MGKINRDLQLKILLDLREKYPDVIENNKDFSCYNDEDFGANLNYLMEHQLVDGKELEVEAGIAVSYQYFKITASGLDFLEDDGGVSAILNTVTVKFDEELRNLLIEKLKETKDGKSLSDSLRSLPGSLVRQVAIRFFNEAMDHWPDAIRILQTSAGQFS